ncbi:GAF domain-containing protein [Mucilaginibacter corticis]|uniref:GAF domain-containing protein n=1 Tax=Mucilaginibacter corticis TaxID=2597670 RepID=A0A556MRW1_9SPHI|nr:LuxR C-terminal-related transcriptional regulator [Mucilaginibacter corticis]TSJ42615.1 GAF domain-containing protein [Mucilaginibacter corticis]
MEENNDQSNLLVSLRVLNQIGASIISEQSIEEMIDTVYYNVNQLIDAYSFAIGIYNPVSERIEYIGARENNIKLPAFSIYAHDRERFSGWIFTHKKEVIINDYATEYALYVPRPVTPLQGMVPASCMYVPLFVQKEIIGILSVRTMVKNAYSARSLEFLKTLSVFISKAIENNRAKSPQREEVRSTPANYHLNPLSGREIEVLNLLAKGFANKAIAGELFVAASTVKTHTLNIYQKLEAANRTEAIVKAKQYGLIN